MIQLIKNLQEHNFQVSKRHTYLYACAEFKFASIVLYKKFLIKVSIKCIISIDVKMLITIFA